MRGKLRDKRATSRWDSVKSEFAERRKLGKRDSKNSLWLNQEPEDDELDLLELEDETEDATISSKK